MLRAEAWLLMHASAWLDVGSVFGLRVRQEASKQRQVVFSFADTRVPMPTSPRQGIAKCVKAAHGPGQQRRGAVSRHVSWSDSRRAWCIDLCVQLWSPPFIDACCPAPCFVCKLRCHTSRAPPAGLVEHTCPAHFDAPCRHITVLPESTLVGTHVARDGVTQQAGEPLGSCLLGLPHLLPRRSAGAGHGRLAHTTHATRHNVRGTQNRQTSKRTNKQTNERTNERMKTPWFVRSSDNNDDGDEAKRSVRRRR